MRQPSPNQVKINSPRLSAPSTDSSTLAKDSMMTKKEIWSMVSRDMADDHSLSTQGDNNSVSSKVSMNSNGSYGSLSSAFSTKRRASGNKPPKSPSSIKSSSSKKHASNSKKKPKMKPEQSTKTIKHSNKAQQKIFDDLEVNSIINDSSSESNSTSGGKYPFKRWATIAATAAVSIFKGDGSRELAKIATQAVLSSEMNGCPMEMVNLAPVAAEACIAVLAAGGSRKSAIQTIVMILKNYEVCGSVGSSNVTSSASKKDERENVEERKSVSETENRDELKNNNYDLYNRKQLNREYLAKYANTVSNKAYQCYEKVSDGTIYKIDDPNEVCKGCVGTPIIMNTLVNKVSDAIGNTGKSITRSFARVIEETASLDKKYRSNNHLNALVPRSRSNPETTVEILKVPEKLQKRDTSDIWKGVDSIVSNSSDEEDLEAEEDSQQANHPQGYDDKDAGPYNVSVQDGSKSVEISKGEINISEERKGEKGIFDSEIINYGREYENPAFISDDDSLLHGDIDNEQFLENIDNGNAMAMSNLTSEYLVPQYVYYDSYHGDNTNDKLTSHPVAASTDDEIIGASINLEVVQQDPVVSLQQRPSNRKQQKSSFHRVKRKVVRIVLKMKSK